MKIRSNKIIWLVLFLLICLSSEVIATANRAKPTIVGDAVTQMNTYIADNYARYVSDPDHLEKVNIGLIEDSIVSVVNGKQVKKYPIQEVWEKYDTIAYDESVYRREVKANPVTPRYLGMAVDGSTLVPNMSHPIDSWTDGRTYEYYNWIKEPWVTPDKSVRGSKGQVISASTYEKLQDKWGVTQLPFDGLASAPFEDKIREGLKLSYYNGKSLWGQQPRGHRGSNK